MDAYIDYDCARLDVVAPNQPRDTRRNYNQVRLSG
jgi:hypothetical protein